MRGLAKCLGVVGPSTPKGVIMDDKYDSEMNLWAAVIRQQLYDATIGTITYGKPYNVPPTASNTGAKAHKNEVLSAREFISGQQRALYDICNAMGLDADFVIRNLLKEYHAVLHLMPPEWRKELRQKD